MQRTYAVLVSMLVVSCGGGGGGPPMGQTAAPNAPCTFTPPAGRATGVMRDDVRNVDVPFDLPEVMCSTLANRDGDLRGMRAVFGTYDPESEDPLGAEPLLIIDTTAFRGKPVADASAWAHIRLPGAWKHNDWGTLTMTDSTHGSFEGGGTHFTFECDASDTMTTAKHAPAPATPAPGTAIITMALRSEVFVVDGVECKLRDRILRVTRNDVGSRCSFVRFDLRPNNSAELVGTGTYPSYFSPDSPIVTQFSERTLDHDSSQGTFDLRGENPVAGYASFDFGPGFAPDRVEFTCPR